MCTRMEFYGCKEGKMNSTVMIMMMMMMMIMIMVVMVMVMVWVIIVAWSSSVARKVR